MRHKTIPPGHPPRRARFARVAASCVLAAFLATQAVAAEDADEITNNNVYLAGAEVRTDNAVGGDLVAAAGRITVNHPVGGDAVLAAGSIEVHGRINDDLRAAGGIISVSGKVSGEALLAGGSVALGPDAEISGRATLAGGDIVAGGRMRGGLKAYGRRLLLIGEVYGPVTLAGEHIEILSSARIIGDVSYSSPHEIRIDPHAQIAGKVTRVSDTFEFPRPALNLPGLPALRPLLLLGLLAAGMLLGALFPRFTRSALHAVGSSPMKSLGLGTAIFFSMPPVILLLVITIIGIPVAFALAAFYAVALLAGYLIVASFVGDRLLGLSGKPPPAGPGWRAIALGIALILLWLAHNVPYAGGFITLLVLLTGVGAMALQAFSDYSARV